MGFFTMIQEGGASMYGILAFDLCAMVVVPIALIVSIVARWKGTMRGVSLTFGILAVVAALMPMCTGVAGYALGMRTVEAAVASVEPAQRDMILKVGEAEAGQNLNLGFGTGCVCLLPAVLALLLVPPRRDEFAD